jgi:hypothetical protein
MPTPPRASCGVHTNPLSREKMYTHHQREWLATSGAHVRFPNRQRPPLRQSIVLQKPPVVDEVRGTPVCVAMRLCCAVLKSSSPSTPHCRTQFRQEQASGRRQFRGGRGGVMTFPPLATLGQCMLNTFVHDNPKMHACSSA